ncbi:MAG TPA: ABC transporter substrate-binding protein, partial [Opitutus sp.]|nr:ABC transporter substrate-binding protein [Opitutus sp.]
GRARELLAAAGFPGGRTFPRLEVTAWSPSQLATLETIQAVWKAQLGIDVGLRIREAKVHLASLTSGDYDIAFVTNLLDVADPLAALGDFTSVAPNNFPHWRSKEFDSLLAAAAAEASAERQSALLARAEALLLAEAPIAPLYFNAQNWLMSPRVRGWKQDALWNRTYHDLRLD